MWWLLIFIVVLLFILPLILSLFSRKQSKEWIDTSKPYKRVYDFEERILSHPMYWLVDVGKSLKWSLENWDVEWWLYALSYLNRCILPFLQLKKEEWISFGFDEVSAHNKIILDELLKKGLYFNKEYSEEILKYLDWILKKNPTYLLGELKWSILLHMEKYQELIEDISLCREWIDETPLISNDLIIESTFRTEYEILESVLNEKWNKKVDSLFKYLWELSKYRCW